jgi:uncharacterized protein with FMN-binding domain
MRKSTAVIIVAAAVLFLGLLGGSVLVSVSTSNLEKLVATKLSDIDLSTAKNGEYVGSYSSFPVFAKVRLTIQDTAIQKIVLVEHRHGQGGSAESILNSVVAANSLSVDCVSGATYSSKVILMAIREALLQAAAKS